VVVPFYQKEHLEMKKVNKHSLFVFLVIALLAFSTSVVFAKELGLLTISGPGIKGEIGLNDHDAMMNLEQSGFFDQAFLSKPPTDLGEGYHMTAHLNLDGKLVPYLQMIYYPTNEGESAYIHYTGRLEGEKLQTIDEWHLLNPKADGALRELLTANKIPVQSALVKAPEPEAVAPAKEPVSAPAVEPVAAAPNSPTPVQPTYLIPALVVGILALMGIALVVKRRAASHPTA
jgi:hypothetical protein